MNEGNDRLIAKCLDVREHGPHNIQKMGGTAHERCSNVGYSTAWNALACPAARYVLAPYCDDSHRQVRPLKKISRDSPIGGGSVPLGSKY